MACLDNTMYNQNKEQRNNKSQYPNNVNPPGGFVSPRISFSNDFADSSSSAALGPRSYRDAPVSTDFEFSVSNYSMMTADELFSQGKLVPLKENRFQRPPVTTLRDELLVQDEDISLRPPKSTRWKGFLGLKKSHIGSRKSERGEGSSSRPPLPSSHHPQEMVNDGGSGSKMDEDEFGF